jgi:hypothetical protein
MELRLTLETGSQRVLGGLPGALLDLLLDEAGNELTDESGNSLTG